MAKSGITDTWLRNKSGKPVDKEITKSDGQALTARIRTSGQISFIYRPLLKNGTRIKMTLGQYPTMTLANARAAAEKYRRLVEQGYDPRRSRDSERHAASEEPTVDEVYEHWYETYCVQKKKGHKAHKASYQNHVQPEFGNIYYKDVDRKKLIEFFAASARKMPAMTKRLMTDLSQAFYMAHEHGLSSRENPLAGIQRLNLFPKTKPKKKRVLNRTEIRQIYQAMTHGNFSGRNRLFFKLLLFYGCRGAELRQTKRSWIDFDRMTWTIPEEYHKTGHHTGQPVVRPIIEEMKHLWEQAIELSDGSDHVFTMMKNAAGTTDKPMNANGAYGMGISLVRHFSARGIPIEHFSTHDIRRTARTFWIRLPGASWEICERMLGHKIPGTTDVYDLSEHCLRMIPIYRAWWQYVTEIETSESEIIDFNQRKQG